MQSLGSYRDEKVKAEGAGTGSRILPPQENTRKLGM